MKDFAFKGPKYDTDWLGRPRITFCGDSGWEAVMFFMNMPQTKAVLERTANLDFPLETGINCIMRLLELLDASLRAKSLMHMHRVLDELLLCAKTVESILDFDAKVHKEADLHFSQYNFKEAGVLAGVYFSQIADAGRATTWGARMWFSDGATQFLRTLSDQEELRIKTKLLSCAKTYLGSLCCMLHARKYERIGPLFGALSRGVNRVEWGVRKSK